MRFDYENSAIDTKTARGAVFYEPVTGALGTPIYQSACFRHPALNESTGFDYSRAANPTRSALESTIAMLERGKFAHAFASGMSAISSLIKIFPVGSHIIASQDIYGGTYRLFSEYYQKYGFSFTFADTSRFSEVEKAARPETSAIFIETPSNPMMKISDIARCAAFIHSRGGFLITDNTFCTPYFQNPLDLGSDFVVHSGTKYLEGHNDTLSGFIIHSNERLYEQISKISMSEGGVLAPFDAFLTIRGIKTLALRMEKHQSNAAAAAGFLTSHPKVEKVFWTGADSHPQRELAVKQMRGCSGMLSFYLKKEEYVHALLKNVRLILFAESLGGVESLITYPWTQTHADIPAEMKEASGVNTRLVRLSCGIENARDIIADLEQALGA